MKNLLLLLVILFFGSKLQAQSGLTFNRVVVIDTTLSAGKESVKYYPPANRVWKVERTAGVKGFNSGSGWVALNVVVNGIRLSSQLPYVDATNVSIYPIWLDENSYIQLHNGSGVGGLGAIISILEFKVD